MNAVTGNGTLYLIDPQTGDRDASVGAGTGSIDLATALPDPATAGYGFDFNPTVDRIRVITSTGLTSASTRTTGAVASTDPRHQRERLDRRRAAAAYTNSFGQAAGAGNPTTLYTLDSAQRHAVHPEPAEHGTQSAGKLVTLDGARLDFTAVNGFDIPAGVRGARRTTPVAAGFGYATLIVGGNDQPLPDRPEHRRGDHPSPSTHRDDRRARPGRHAGRHGLLPEPRPSAAPRARPA